MIVCTYLAYWWRLALAHLSNWTFSVFLVPPQILGNAHAKLDVSHDILKVYYSGLKPLWHLDSEETLRTDYEIEYLNINHLDHCQWHESYETAYNRVSQKALRDKFGMDVVDLCLTKAELNFRSQQIQKTA